MQAAQTHARPFALYARRSTLHASAFLLRNLIRPIPRHAELRHESSDDVASTASLGSERACSRAHIRFTHRTRLATGENDDHFTSCGHVLVVRAERTDRSASHFLVLLCHFAGHGNLFSPGSMALEIGERVGQSRRCFVQNSSM